VYKRQPKPQTPNPKPQTRVFSSFFQNFSLKQFNPG
jgi:hypothetical protein